MTHKVIAERLRGIAERERVPNRQTLRDLNAIANEFDPPKPEPEPGKVVLWRHKDRPMGFIYGIVVEGGDGSYVYIDKVEWKPSQVCGPDEMPVKIPPVSEWPEDTQELTVLFEGETKTHRYKTIITRSEAERMEAER